MTWPTRIEHGREVIDGSQLPDGATLRVRLHEGEPWREYYVDAETLDGEPVDAVQDVARRMVIGDMQVEVTRG